jgi:hypothetical protein
VKSSVFWHVTPCSRVSQPITRRCVSEDRTEITAVRASDPISTVPGRNTYRLNEKPFSIRPTHQSVT